MGGLSAFKTQVLAALDAHLLKDLQAQPSRSNPRDNKSPFSYADPAALILQGCSATLRPGALTGSFSRRFSMSSQTQDAGSAAAQTFGRHCGMRPSSHQVSVGGPVGPQ